MINPDATAVILKALQASRHLNETEIERLLLEIDHEKQKMVPDCYLCASPCGKNNPFDIESLQQEDPDIRDLKYSIIDSLQVLAKTCNVIEADSAPLLYQSLILIGIEGISAEVLQRYQSQLIYSIAQKG